MGCCPTKRLKLDDDFFTIDLRYIETNNKNDSLMKSSFDHCPIDQLVLCYIENHISDGNQIKNLNDWYAINPFHLKIDKNVQDHIANLQKVHIDIITALENYKTKIS